eukprot:6455056-Amphidinium_carterae.2
MPNHDDYSLGYLSLIIESKIKRDHCQKYRPYYRDYISQHIRSCGMAIPAVDMSNDNASDAPDSSTLPATPDKPKGVCFGMLKQGKCIKVMVKKEQERRRARSPKNSTNKDTPRGSARSPGRSQERKPSPSGDRRSSPRDGRNPSSKGGRERSGSRGRSPNALRSSSPCHEYKANGTCKYGDKCLCSHALCCLGWSVPCHKCDCADVNLAHPDGRSADARRLVSTDG